MTHKRLFNLIMRVLLLKYHSFRRARLVTTALPRLTYEPVGVWSQTQQSFSMQLRLLSGSTDRERAARASPATDATPYFDRE
jgi:hypothetical protein